MTNKVCIFLTLTVILFLTNFTNAQIQKGKWISSAGIDIDINDGKSSSPQRTEKRTYWRCDFQQGYFISNQFSIGIGGAFSNNNTITRRDDGSYAKGKTATQEIYVFGQWYKKIKGKFYYSPQAYIDYFKDKVRIEEKDPIFNPVISTSTYDNYGLQINPAHFSYLLNKSLVIETSLCYVIIGKRDGKTINPLETETGGSTSFKMNFSPFISNIKISLLF